MIYRLGPRARRVYLALRDRITRGEWPPGRKLPSHRDLAVEFGVAPLTMRQVLAQLDDEGLVSRQSGRGTFVREMSRPAILLMAATPPLATFLADYVRRAGYRALAAEQAEAAGIVADDPAIVLALCDLEGSPPGGIDGIRMLRSRRPQLPVAALVADLRELQDLFGTAEWPVHILPKPVNLGLLDEVLRLASRRAGG